MREVRETLSRLERGSEPEIPALVDADAGPEKKVYSGAHDSARFLARRRREAAQADPSSAPPEPSGVDLEIAYTDGRETVDAKTTARDLADYRARMAAQLLEGVDPTEAAVRASGVQQEAPVAEQPVEQPAEQPQPEQSERTHYTRDEVETAAVQQLQNYSDRIGAILLSIRGVGVPPELANIQTPQAWAALQSTDPQKAAQIATYIQNRAGMAAQLESELGAVRQQQQEIQSAQFNRWASSEEAKFEKSAGTITREMQIEALATLRDAGVSDEEAAQAWNGRPMQLRSAAAQKILLDATRWRLAEAKAKAAIARPNPPPQRPGVRQDIRPSVVDLNALSRRLDEAGSAQQQLKLAGQLVASRRRAAQG
jgi:hypothetical protein